MAGREKELKHGDHSLTRQPSPPLVSSARVHEARAEGLDCRRAATSPSKQPLISQYHILIHCLGREVVALKRQNRFEYFILMLREDARVKMS